MEHNWGWRHEAECRGADTTFFFAPHYFERRADKNAREAKAKILCDRCAVRDECLEFAMSTDEQHGIWGGLNEMERRALVRRRRGESAAQAG
ncbi:MAG: WhiB family transcriptional regulator [Actinomycetota bacterium]